MRIGICDDNVNDRCMIEKICTDAIASLSMDCEVVVFETGNEVLAYEKELHLLVLDVEMPVMDGFQIKQRLQDRKQETIIIYVTDHDELVLSAFGIYVYGFVMKKNIHMQLAHMLGSALEMLSQFIILEDGTDSREIKYIKSERIYSDMYFSDGRKKATRISMKEYENLLCKVGFVRTHKSYLVNLKWVDKVAEKELFIGTEKLPVATRLQKEVRASYQRFCEKNARYC